MIGLLNAFRTVRPFGGPPGSGAHLARLIQQTLFHQQHSMVGLIDARLVQLGKFGRQFQCFRNILFGLNELVKLDLL